jgi:putative tricarboxylic transport membrane protein
VLIVCVIGVVGFFMRVYDFPVAPAILGSILGPMMETQLRRAVSISQGDFSVFFTRPLTVGLLLVAGAMLILPTVLPKMMNRRHDGDRVGAE